MASLTFFLLPEDIANRLKEQLFLLHKLPRERFDESELQELLYDIDEIDISEVQELIAILDEGLDIAKIEKEN